MKEKKSKEKKDDDLEVYVLDLLLKALVLILVLSVPFCIFDVYISTRTKLAKVRLLENASEVDKEFVVEVLKELNRE